VGCCHGLVPRLPSRSIVLFPGFYVRSRHRRYWRHSGRLKIHAFENDHVLHLDLKPENVLFDIDIRRAIRRQGPDARHERFMLSDWGIASIKQSRLEAIAGTPLTSELSACTFNNMGTILYMAPERFVAGYRSSQASDVFSLGMIYFELLMGGLPFNSEEHPVRSLLSGSYFECAALALRSAAIPRAIRNLILTMMSPRPEDRPATYHALHREVVSTYRKSTGFLSKLLN
jgi:serine/threonine protein kinase